MSRAELLQRALELPEDERAEFAYEILHSMKLGLEDPEWTKAWMEEIERRSKRHEKYPHEARDWRDVMVELRASLKKESNRNDRPRTTLVAR